jgi:hypothetical protein
MNMNYVICFSLLFFTKTFFSCGLPILDVPTAMSMLQSLSMFTSTNPHFVFLYIMVK